MCAYQEVKLKIASFVQRFRYSDKSEMQIHAQAA